MSTSIFRYVFSLKTGGLLPQDIKMILLAHVKLHEVRKYAT